MSVRIGRVEDSRRIAEINVRSWQVSYRGLIPDDFLDSMDPEKRIPFIEDVIQNHHSLVAVDAEGVVVGFVLLGPPFDKESDPSDVIELYSIYVEPDLIGSGLGRTLMNGALDVMRRGSWTRAILWTLKNTHRTSRFYEIAGWRLDGHTKQENVPGSDPLESVRFQFDL